MRKALIVLAIAMGIAIFASPAFLQMEKPHSKEDHGTMGGGMMQQGGMMCPMMGSGNMGMMGGGTGGMMGAMGGGDPKMAGRMMEMRGEMMMKMGEVMMKHGKLMQKEDTK